MQKAVRDAMRAGRVTMEVGREELHLLSLCDEALATGAEAVPIAIHPEPLKVRPKGRRGQSEKARQKKARRANRRPKKGRKR